MRASKSLHGWAIAAAALVICGLLAMQTVDRIMRSAAIDETRANGTNNARILAAGLESELEKFSLVPPVLAEDRDVIALMRGDRARTGLLDARLEMLADQTGAASIYLMDRSGLTLSASNHSRPESFVGSNYAFRPYFRDAMATGRSAQFALGTVSRRPGLYIARRVRNNGDDLGVVVLKVEFDALEESWRRSERSVYVTDRDGIVLIASNPAWRFNAATSQARENPDRTDDLQRLGVSSFPPLKLARYPQRTVALALDRGDYAVAPPGWRIHLLVDPTANISDAVSRGRLAVGLAMALLAMLGGAALYFRRRREEARERDLARRTGLLREQLSQANRLATLGQIGAGISHEIRQPVAAIRMFAETGSRLVDAGELERAKGNFARIAQLAERIGTITGELLRFSRRGTHAQRAMPIGQVIDGALLLLNERIAGQDVALDLPGPEQRAIDVLGEHVRLEQVLVNLVQNALDAVGQRGRVAIDLVAGEQKCLLTVEDDGPGLTEQAMDQLFHPFATTKEDGLGLGLVISQEIMRDLGGDLKAEARSNGARFIMEIPLA